MTTTLTLVLAALAVGLGNVAVAIGIGLSGASRRTGLKVGVVFGVFESGMPLVGLLLGRGVAEHVGPLSRYGGGALLVATGLWTLWGARSGESDAPPATNARLLVMGLALSMDNLVVGFSLGVQHISLPQTLLIFLVVTVVLTLAGLEFGRRLGRMVESRSEYLAGGVLVLVGALVMLGTI